MKLKDKVSIITGGGTGIGRAIATLFASEGSIIVVASRTISQLEVVVQEIIQKGGRAKAVQTDITDEKQIQTMVSSTLKDFGYIDILINNSSHINTANIDIIDMDKEYWNNTINVNLTGTMLCTREVLKNMIERKSGSIVNIGSIASISGIPYRSAYTTTKWGIIGFTESLSIEVGQYNIRVNSLSPGGTLSQGFEDAMRAKAKHKGISFEKFMSKILSHYSLKRLARPSEIAQAALFLASEDSSAITGQNIVVSCGFHMLHPNEIN